MGDGLRSPASSRKVSVPRWAPMASSIRPAFNSARLWPAMAWRAPWKSPAASNSRALRCCARRLTRSRRAIEEPRRCSSGPMPAGPGRRRVARRRGPGPSGRGYYCGGRRARAGRGAVVELRGLKERIAEGLGGVGRGAADFGPVSPADPLVGEPVHGLGHLDDGGVLARGGGRTQCGQPVGALGLEPLVASQAGETRSRTAGAPRQSAQR